MLGCDLCWEMLGNAGARGHTSEPRPGPATTWLLLVAGVWKAAGVMVMVASAGVMGEHCHMFPPAQVLTSSHPASSKILSEVLLSHKLAGGWSWQTWCLFVP